MALRKAKIYFPFTEGVNRKIDEKYISPPVLIDAQNAIYSKEGTVQKRNGYDELGTDDSETDVAMTARGRNLARREDELVMLHENFVYTQDPVRNEWVQRGKFAGPVLRSTPEAFRTTDQVNNCTAEVSNVRITAWQDSMNTFPVTSSGNSIGFQITNSQTGAVYVPPTIITGASKPRCVATGSRLFLYAVGFDGATPRHIRVWEVDLTDPTDNLFTPGNSTLISATDLDEQVDSFDVQASVVDDTIYLIEVDNASAPDEEPRVFHFDTDGVSVLQSLIISSQAGARMVCINQNPAGNNEVGIAWLEQTVFVSPVQYEIRGQILSTTLTSVTAVVSLETLTTVALAENVATFAKSMANGWTTSTQMDVLFTEPDDIAVYNTRIRGLNTAGAVTGSANTFLQRRAVPASRVFYEAGNWQLWLAYESDLQSTYFCVRQDGEIIARSLAGIASGYPGNGAPGDLDAPVNIKRNPVGKYITDVSIVGRRFTVALPYKTRLDTSQVTTMDAADMPTTSLQQNPVYTERGVREISLDFGDAQGFQAREAGDIAYINGGMIWQYDGIQAYESGFHVFPENFTGIGAAPGPLPTAQFSYRVYYEWTNARGQRERSTTAGIIAVSITGPNGIDVTVPTLTFTNKTDVSIVVFRSEGDPNFDSPFYRVSSPDPETNGNANGYILNDPTVETITFHDQLADSVLTRQELDPANSGELDNVMPPAPTILAEGKNRLFIASFEDDSLVRFSKLRRDEGPFEFNDALLIPMEDGGGQVTGMTILNETLIIFKETRMYVVAGEGPNNLGFGTFSDPQRISSDVGCKDQRSIVQTPMGIMFQSNKGIYLLNQQFQIQYIGSAVEDIAIGEITAATLLEDTNRVVFLSDSGETLVYDFFFNQWSTWTNHTGRGAIVHLGKLNYLRSDQRTVFQETPGQFLDSNVGYPLRIRTGWFKLEGMQNYQRVRRLALLGNFKSAHDLTCEVDYNYKETLTQTVTYTPDTPEKQDPYQFRVFPGIQKCLAIRLTVFDVPVTGRANSEQAYEITEVAFEVGLKETTFKTERAAR